MQRRVPVSSWLVLVIVAVTVVVALVGAGRGLLARSDGGPSAAPTPTSTRWLPERDRQAAKQEARQQATSAKASGQEKLAALAPAAMVGDAAEVALMGVDLTTGEQVAWSTPGFGTTIPGVSASIAKLDIAEAVLWRADRDGEPLLEEQDDLLAAMLTLSDNDAADTLFDALGGNDGLTEANAALGVRATTLDEEGQWGLAVAPPVDHARLLRNLVMPDSPLSQRARTQILDLMGDVAEDQDWGVGRLGAHPAVKNGWLPWQVDEDADEVWVLNSIGIATDVDGHLCAIIVLTTGWPEQDRGIEVVDMLARDVLDSLGS